VVDRLFGGIERQGRVVEEDDQAVTFRRECPEYALEAHSRDPDRDSEDDQDGEADDAVGEQGIAHPSTVQMPALLPPLTACHPGDTRAMRVYKGSPRRDYEEVLRSIGAAVDAEYLNSLVLMELAEGFFGTAIRSTPDPRTAADIVGRFEQVRLNFNDDELAGALERGFEHRDASPGGGVYEHALRLIGRWMDREQATQVFLMEQAGSFIVRVLPPFPGTNAYTLAEFTAADLERLEVEAGSERG
jgi:hypothetical protein